MKFSFVPAVTLFILVLETSAISVNNVTDQQALICLKTWITNDPLGMLDSWNNSIHFCQWNGVTCSQRRQRVTALDLSSQNLAGTLSPCIGNLSFLKIIDLSQNNFDGSIPNEVGRLLRLQYLDLGLNYFRGEFPANLSQCADLRNISMDDNNLKGTLLLEFASWPKLYSFVIGKNNFDGLIPPSIGNTSSLRILDLGFNNLRGGIHLKLAHHTKLQILDLGTNYLRGVVPAPLYNISSLCIVELSDNVLNGTLPSDLGFTLPKLQEFYAGNNTFTGALPPSLANASSLVIFEVQKNSITGPIPNNLGSLRDLEWLSLGQNPLGDNMQPGDWSFLNSLVNCTRLKTLILHESKLRGKLPRFIVNLSTTLEELYLFQNHISGSIPREIGKLENIKVLSMAGNILTGTIPESIGKLSKLGLLSFHDNHISGVIPTSIANISQLVVLRLHNNMILGSIPADLFTISTLETVFLSYNRLTGVIPEEIAFSSHCLSLDLSYNLLRGSLPSKIGSWKQLVRLSVSNNKLDGEIPATLGGCVMLEELLMDKNLFQGKIPSSFKTLRSLRILDLSSNNISKNIPRFFERFNQIEYLNLSHNKLGGEVPKEGPFSNRSAFSVVGNLELCGGIEALHLPACPVKVSRNKKKTCTLRLILLLIFVPLAILLACVALIRYQCRNSKKLNNPVPVFKENQYLKISYQDLLLATNEFSPNNLIGEGRYGSVYRGVLESEELVVAVKVLDVEVRGANKSFLAECETLRNIRHRNLIKIITACSSTDFKGNDFKALVFEFMTNGSLDNWLHPSPSYQANARNLTLLQRLNIAIDVALGVDYLHHHSHASIIHSDIKPSNILLDQDFVAHIGDFGLARFSFTTTSVTNQAQMSSTGVRGTIGYVPPEYGMGVEISAEGDVYSYGIFLLEMFSGKRPTCSSVLLDNSNNLHDYVRKALPQRVMNIVDPRIIIEQEGYDLATNQSYSKATLEVCLASIFEVGILCSVELPRERIDISVAVKRLHVARDKLLQHRQ